MLRRLYSSFAGGWPGFGLLLMRFVIGSVVLWHVATAWGDAPLRMIVSALLAVAGLLLIVGLWTPIAGAVVAVVAIVEMLTTGELNVGRLLAATIAGALAMLGPGRLSIDARLFGWRRIDIPAHRNNSSDLRQTP